MEPLLNLIGIIAGVAVSFGIGYKSGYSNRRHDELAEWEAKKKRDINMKKYTDKIIEERVKEFEAEMKRRDVWR